MGEAFGGHSGECRRGARETFGFEDVCHVLDVFHAGDVIRFLFYDETGVLLVNEHDRT